MVAGASVVLVLAVSAVLSALAVIGSRSRPLANTVGSPEALGAAVLSAFQQVDLASLRSLALTEEEFRAHVWPDLPISRPERNVPFEFAWRNLRQTSDGYLRQLVAQFNETDLTLLRVEFGGPATAYGEVTVHRDTRLVVRGPDGEVRTLRLFGSTIEQDGRYKIFSFVVDE